METIRELFLAVLLPVPGGMAQYRRVRLDERALRTTHYVPWDGLWIPS